ncbi:MAG TPA: hypothetical protein GXZ68_02220 [Firmicutes bacterium]|nr:hypothetical protein [Bacillota bacterium]
MIKQSCELNRIDTMVMIRPRGGDFLYSREKITPMRGYQNQCRAGRSGSRLGRPPLPSCRRTANP